MPSLSTLKRKGRVFMLKHGTIYRGGCMGRFLLRCFKEVAPAPFLSYIRKKHKYGNRMAADPKGKAVIFLLPFFSSLSTYFCFCYLSFRISLFLETAQKPFLIYKRNLPQCRSPPSPSVPADPKINRNGGKV